MSGEIQKLDSLNIVGSCGAREVFGVHGSYRAVVMKALNSTEYREGLENEKIVIVRYPLAMVSTYRYGYGNR